MAQHSGFFNAMESGGVYDRTYNADDYTSNLAAIISTGVRRSSEDDLKVTASGLNVSVNVGRAWIDGRWYYNDTVLALQTVTPPTGALARKDGVYLQANSNTAVRSIQLVYKTGTPASTPTAPACVRSGGIYEIQLATITVQPNAEGVTVTDTRANKTLCGWITTPVGYDDFFASYDNEFTEWFDETKDTLASVTLFKQYLWSGTTSGASTTSVTFSIPQYDSTGTDIINVYVNGLLQTPTTDYTLSGSTITFTAGKTAGTKIIVMCYKSIDGSDLGDVSDEITALQAGLYTRCCSDAEAAYIIAGIPEAPASVTVNFDYSDNGRVLSVVMSYTVIEIDGEETVKTEYASFDMLTGQYVTTAAISDDVAEFEDILKEKLADDVSNLPDQAGETDEEKKAEVITWLSCTDHVDIMH